MSPEVFATVFPLWIKAFLLTLAVEVPLFILIARSNKTVKKNVPIWRLALAAGAGTMITHPLLWFAWPHVVSDYTTYIITGELLVAVIETFTFYLIARPIKLKLALASAFIANGASYGIGVLISSF